MRILYCLKILYKIILKNRIRFLFSFFVIVSTIAILSFSILFAYANQYNRISTNEILKKNIDSTGILYVSIDKLDQQKISLISEYLNDLRDLDEIDYIADMSGMTGTIAEQEFFKYGEDAYKTASSKCMTLTQEAFDIINYNLYNGIDPHELSIEDSYTQYVYLGYNYRDIPLGTIYEKQTPAGIVFRVIIAGVLEKNQRILNCIDYAFFDSTTMSNYINTDDIMLIVSKDVSGFPLFFDVNNEYTYSDAKEKIICISEKYGYPITISSIGEKYLDADVSRGALQKVLKYALFIIAVSSICTLLVFAVYEVKDNLRAFGLLFANGISDSDMIIVIIMKKMIETIICFILSYLLLLLVTDKMFAVYSDVETIVKDVLKRYVLPRISIICTLWLILSSLLLVVSFKIRCVSQLLLRKE